MTIYSGTVVSGALELSSGDIGLDIFVDGGGKLILSSGGMANDVVIEGLVIVQSGGVVENVEAVGPFYPYCDGGINIYSGGSGRNITIHSGYAINGFRLLEETHFDNVENGVVHISGALVEDYCFADAFISSGSTARDVTVSGEVKLHIYDGGSAAEVDVNTLGRVYVSSGGFLSDSVVSGNARLFADEGSVLNNILIKSGGSLNGFVMKNDSSFSAIYDGEFNPSGTILENYTVLIDKGKEINDVDVGYSGQLNIGDGGKANNILASVGGRVILTSGAEVNNVINKTGYIIVYDGAKINTITSENSEIIISGSAEVNNFTNNNGKIIVSGGAIVNGFSQSAGSATFMAGARINSAYILGFGTVYDDVVLNDVRTGAYLKVSGGVLNNVQNLRSLGLYSGSEVNNLLIGDYITNSYASTYLYEGAVASNVEISSHSKLYISGGTAYDVQAGGVFSEIRVSSGGRLERAAISNNAFLYGYDGSTISNLTVYYGGFAEICKGEDIRVEKGGLVYVDAGAVGLKDITLAGGKMQLSGDDSNQAYIDEITFELSGRLADPLIDADISRITCSQYYLSVAEDNNSQEYILCSNSNGFSQSITVTNSMGDELGVLTAGETLVGDRGKYSLSEENGQLLLNYTAFVVNENISGLTVTIKSAEELAAGDSLTLTSVNYTISDSQIGVFSATNGVLNGGAANVAGTVAVTVTSTSGDGIGAIYGGGLGLNQSIGEDVLLTLESGVYGYIYAGGYSAVSGNVKTVIGDVTVNNNIYGGTAYTNPDSFINNVGGSTTVEISSGVILNQVYAGNYVNCDNFGGEVKSTVSGGSYLNISGGTFTGPVVMAGGVGVATGSGSSYVISEVNGGTHVNVTGGEISYLYGGGRGGASTVNADYGASVVNDGSHITISGGDIKVVYGGGYCDAGYSYVNGGASITLTAGTIGTVFGGGSGTGGAARNSIVDNVNITVDATGDLSIADIYGGGNGRAQVSGDVTITLHGSNGHNLSINGLISGGGRNGVSGVGGDRTLQFEDYQGSLDATIANFTTIRVNEYTEVALSKVQDFSTVDTFIFDTPMQTNDTTAGMLLSGDTVWGGSKLLKLNVDSGVYDAEIVLLSNLGNDISSFADANYEFNVLGTLEDGYSSGVMSGIDLESGLGSAWYNEIDEAYYRLEIGEFDTLAGLDLRLKVIDAYSDEGLQLKAQLA